MGERHQCTLRDQNKVGEYEKREVGGSFLQSVSIGIFARGKV